MKIILKDYKTGELIGEQAIIDGDVFKLAQEANTWGHEYEEALYFINNGDAMQGVIADEWTDNGEPVNPYLTYEVTP